MSGRSLAGATPRDLYLRLLRDAILGLTVPEPQSLKAWGAQVAELPPPNLDHRRPGLDWPAEGVSMAGELRLDNVRECVEDVLARGVPGDLIETGVWRGGTTIFMRGILAAH